MKKKYKPVILGLGVMVGIVLILITGPLVITELPFLLIQVFGWLLIGWARLSRKVNKQTHHDLPRDLFFVDKGPYEILRHPIYTGLLFVMAGYVQGYPSIIRFLLFALLVVLVILKIKNDEARMHAQVKEYSAYEKRTHSIIPYFY